MKVALAHYHLRPGGVSRVIENTREALAAFSEVEVCLVTDAYDYAVEDAPPPHVLAETLHRACPDADLWHVHNPTLGKHRTLPDALAQLGKPLLLQVHDFAEDHRPTNLEVAAQAGTLYPAAHYATVNTRDRDILIAAGLDPARAHFLPNPILIDPAPPGPPARERPLIFYPVRGIPRKNLGEVALLAAAAPEYDFAVAAAPENPQHLEDFEHWWQVCRELDLPVRFDVVRDADGQRFDDWYGRADAIITTSIQEGFGLAFLEASARGRPLIGRDLPEITRDFAEAGLRFPQLYSRLLIDGRDFADRSRCEQSELVERLARGHLSPDRVVAKADRGQRPLQECLVPDPSEIEPNRESIAEHYSPERHAGRLVDAYRKAVASPAPRAEIDALSIRRHFEGRDLANTLRSLSHPIEPEPTGLAPRLEALSGLRAVLFDVYGTLFVSGASSEPIAALAEGVARSHAESRAAGEPFPEVDVRELWRQVLGRVDVDDHALHAEVEHNPVWPMPHLVECLQALNERGLCLGIISNAQFFTPLLFPALAGEDLASLGFDPELCLYSYQEGCAKPSPALFARAASRLAARGILPEQTLYVGNDAAKDIAPAAAAGFRTALFAGCARSYRPLDGVVPDLVVTDLAQLPGAIAK